MTVSRRKPPAGFSSPVEETTEVVTETPVEVVEEKVEEVAEKVEKVVEKVHPAVTPVLGSNPKPVTPRTPSPRNNPRFSPQR